MKHAPMMFAIAAAFALNPAYGMEREEPVAVNVDHLRPKIAEEVRKHADEGLTSLKRYLESKRPREHLWLDDVMRPREEPAWEITRVASREYKRHAIEWR